MYMVHDSTQNKTGYHESTNTPLSRGPGGEVEEKTETFSLWQQETGKMPLQATFCESKTNYTLISRLS